MTGKGQRIILKWMIYGNPGFNSFLMEKKKPFRVILTALLGVFIMSQATRQYGFFYSKS